MGPSAAEASSSLRVRLFARLREEAGWAERPWPLPASGEPITPLEVWRQLNLGGQGPLPAGVRVAVNQRFAPPDQPLQPGDELAFLPPISGG